MSGLGPGSGVRRIARTMRANPAPGDRTAGNADDVRVVPAARADRAALVDLFNRSYSDYFVPVALTEDALEAIAGAWDIDFEASRIVRRGDVLLGFSFRAIRGRRGWIGGMGVPPEARGAGWGRVTLEAVLDEARARGLEHVDLEVLEPNTPASRIYEQCGFVDRRRLDVLVRAPAPPPDAPSPAAGLAIAPVPAARCLELHAHFHPEGVPWQRDLPVLERQRDRLEALGLTRGDRLLGWVLTLGDAERTGIQDIALAGDVDVAHATALVRASLATRPGATFRVLNLPRDAREAGAFASLGFEAEWTQREMRIALASAPA